MLTDTRGAADAMAPRPATTQVAGPYVGLRPYEASERNRFFGRDNDALFLCNKILSARLTILYSQSGLGKSSLLRTLVIPQLENDGPVIYFEAWSQETPLAALKEKLAKHAAALGVPSPEAGAPTLTQLVRLIRTEDPRPLTLVLDQFEEFLTTHGNELDPLRAELAELTRTTQIDVQVILSLREEFLAALEPFREQILSLFQSTYRLEGLDEESLRDAIRLPSRVFNGSCDDELVEILMRDLKSKSQVQQDSSAIAIELPTLQLVGSQLWDEAQRAGQSRLTVALYEKAGGVKKILDRYITASMPRSWRDQVLAARLMRLLAPPSGVKISYSADDLAENIGADKRRVESLLDDLAAARILQTRHSKRGRRYELQHDAFIAVITPWRDQVLTRRARIRQTLVTLSVVAGLLLIVSIGSYWDRSYRRAAERQAALRDLIHHVENELEARPAFNLLLATTAYALGRSEGPELQVSTESALRRALSRVGGVPFADPAAPVTTISLSRDGSRLVTGGAKGVLVWDVDADSRSMGGLAQPVDPRRVTNDATTRCVMSPAGQWLATTAGGNGARILNLNAVAAKPIDIALGAAASAMRFSADDQLLAIGLDNGQVEIWSIGTPGQPVRRATLSPPASFTSERLYAVRFGMSNGEPSLFVAYEGQVDEQRHGIVVRWMVGTRGASAPEIFWSERTERGYIAMAIGEDAHRVAALTVSDDVRVANLDDRTPSDRLDLTGIVGRALTFAALAFGSGDSLAVADRSGAIGLWNATTKQRARVLLGHDGLVNDLSLSADGRWMASASRDGTARLWDLGQFGTHPWAFGADGHVLRDLAFSGDRPWLVTAGSNGIRRFALAGRNATTDVLATPEQSEFGVLDASEDSRWLAAGRDDGAMFVWNDPFRDGPAEAKLLGKFDEKVSAVAISRDSRWMAMGSDDKRLLVWSLSVGASPQLAIDHRHRGEVTELAFSPESAWLASGTSMGDIAVWRLGAEPQQKSSKQLSEQPGRVTALAFDRRGQLAIALDDGKVRTWDAERTRWAAEPWQVRPLRQDLPENDAGQSTEYVNSLAFSPDGRWLIAGTIFERLLRRQMAGTSSWRELFGLAGRSSPQVVDLAQRRTTAARGVKGAVTALAFASDGRIASSISDRPVAIETVDGPPYSTALWGPTRKVWKLAFSGSQTSDRFIGAVAEDRAWVWSVPSRRRAGSEDDIIQLSCRAAGRKPACDDLQARLVGLPNWDVCSVCSGAAGR